MSEPDRLLNKSLLENALNWFQSHFHQTVVNPIESQLGMRLLIQTVKDVLDHTEAVSRIVSGWSGTSSPPVDFLGKLSAEAPHLLPLFKCIILLYRRHRAAETERRTEKTLHLELVEMLEQEVKALDALTAAAVFECIEHNPLPRLKDFLPVEYIEGASVSLLPLSPRQFDEKFHILQAPNLFLPDVGYYRGKCEGRETPLAIAFIDIDDFKRLNSQHTELKVDRNLLPRFMQTLEAHLFHHGYAYRQGGDEYLLLVPSLSRSLSIHFLDELSGKLADLSYPDIAEKTTVSIGLCVVEPDCSLTDRELLDRANRAKQFAKEKGKNRIATYRGPRFLSQELEVVSGPAS